LLVVFEIVNEAVAEDAALLSLTVIVTTEGVSVGSGLGGTTIVPPIL